MVSEEVDLRKVRPSDYLKNGFFDRSGDWIDGVNGFFSLATAHHLLDEGTAPDQVKKVSDQLMALSLDLFGDAEMIEYQFIDDLSQQAILRIMDSEDSRQSAVLTELFDTVRPYLKNWKNFAALVIHLERISGHLTSVANSR